MKRSKRADPWYEQGKHELEGAKSLRKNGFYDMCALACQQAAEKLIKALWADVKGQDPPRVHWVERLAAELEAPQDVIDAASELVASYTMARYPVGGGAPFTLYSAADSDSRIAKAEAILAWVESQWESGDGS